MFRFWLFAFVLMSSGAMAQQAPGTVPSPGERDFIRDRQQQLLEEQRQRLEDLKQLPGPTPDLPKSSESDAQCFEIRTIELQGATLIPQPDRDAILARFEGQCLGSNQLNNVPKAVTQFYLDRGYVTSRAYLPQQDLSSGVLKVLVVEGALEGLDSSDIASDRELYMAYPGRTGAPVNLRELEQMVDQLNRLPSRQAALELLPGEDVGGSRVRLQGARSKPWRVSASRHNAEKGTDLFSRLESC